MVYQDESVAELGLEGVDVGLHLLADHLRSDALPHHLLQDLRLDAFRGNADVL